MFDLQVILAKQETVLASATDALRLDDAIKAVLDAKNARMAEMQAQIDKLIAGGNVTTDDLQKLSDGMDAIITAQDTDAEAKAILAGTPPGTEAL